MCTFDELVIQKSCFFEHSQKLLDVIRETQVTLTAAVLTEKKIMFLFLKKMENKMGLGQLWPPEGAPH